MIDTDTAFNKAQQSELPTSTYLSPAEVAEIFPDITVDQLCQQLSDITLVHNEVPVIVPSFAVAQMSRFLQLIEVSSLAPVALPAKKPLQSEPTGVQAPADDTVNVGISTLGFDQLNKHTLPSAM